MMNVKMVTCENGHLFNPSEFERCPHCFGDAANKQVCVTVPERRNRVEHGIEEDIPCTPVVPPRAKSMMEVDASFDDEECVTVCAYKAESGFDPVVGWLIGLNGANRGEEYRIHAENNFIGRSSRMDICIRGDETVSRENHVRIAYEVSERKFFLVPGESRNIVRVNRKALLMSQELHPYDIIHIGAVDYLFFPLCGEKFDWFDTANVDQEVI